MVQEYGDLIVVLYFDVIWKFNNLFFDEYIYVVFYKKR